MTAPVVSRWRRRVIYGAVAVSPALLVIAYGQQRQRWAGLDRAGVAFRLRGAPERCLACHQREAGALPAHHSAEALGCSTCHLGNPGSLDKERAHAGLERFPGDLSTAWRTCGRLGCHPAAVARVQVSLMGSPRGLLAVDRQAFAGSAAPQPVNHAWNRVTAPSDFMTPDQPAEAHARKLCASCHLATRHRSAKARSRGGGCTACHLKPGTVNDAHPQLRLGVTPEVCTGCHSRSGRVALSYYGWHEGVAVQGHGPPPGAAPPVRQRRLADGRTVRRARADVHHRAGMTCLDCHTARGLMGDGERYAHKEQQVDIACTDCHGRRGPARHSALRKDEEAALRIGRYLVAQRIVPATPVGSQVARTARGTALLALRQRPDGTWVLRRRLDGRALRVRPTPRDAAHTLAGHERLTCQACHTDWSHQCYGCHTRRDDAGRQWDNVAGAYTAGRWVETPGPMIIDAPALGVQPDGRIGPFLPGMPICVELARKSHPLSPARSSPAEISGRAGSTVCSRLYAPADPHTTQRRSRSCGSCHRSTQALGLGKGRAELRRGRWRFVADPGGPPAGTFPMPIPAWPDGVPWDGWTRLDGAPAARATRLGARPLSPGELRRILEVGRCVSCHRRASDPIYRHFPTSLALLRMGRASRCRIHADTMERAPAKSIKSIDE